MYKVNVLKTLGECKSYEGVWDELAVSMGYPSPFVHPDWVLAALKINESKWTPYILLIQQNDKLTGLLPLYKNITNSVREIRYAGDRYHPDPLGLCCSVEDRRKCIGAIKKYLFQCNDWDILRLKWLLHDESVEWGDADSTSFKGTIAPFLKLPETFDEYLKTFKSKKRYNLNASVRKFEKLGGHYYAAVNYDDVQNVLKCLFNLHEKRSAERDIISSFSGMEISKFHSAIVRNMKNVWLRYLEIDGEIIAVLYGFLLHRRFFYYQIAHDPSFRAQSPGTVILYKVIEECCDLGVVEFNFLQGDEKYKCQWTKDSRTLYDVELYNTTFSGVLSKYKNKARSLSKSIVSGIRQSKLINR